MFVYSGTLPASPPSLNPSGMSRALGASAAGIVRMWRMKAKPRSTLGQACTQPILVAGQARVPRDGPQRYAGFLPVRVHQHEAAVVALEAHQVFDAVARLVRPAQVSHRLQQERAVHHPQPAVAGGADLESGQAVLDFARLVDVADGGIQQGLHAGVRDFQVVVGQRLPFCQNCSALRRNESPCAKSKGRSSASRPRATTNESGSLAVRRNHSFREVQDQAAPGPLACR